MWFPTTFFDRSAATPAFLAVMNETARRSFLAFQHFANDPKYGVFWIRQFGLRDEPPAREMEPWPGGDALYPGLRRRASGKGPLGFPHWDGYYTMMIDPDLYLRALVNDFQAAGGRMVRTRFDTAADVENLPQQTIVNCTGLGAAALFEDADLIPARGQLTMLLPQPEIDYGYTNNSEEHGLLYMFPRKTCVVLGGSVDYGDWSLQPDAREITRMVAGHAAVADRA